MNLFITGATGFLGWNLARWFSENGHLVHGSYHRIPPLDTYCTSWFHLDLENPQANIPSIPTDCDVIIHCAAMASSKECDVNRDRAFRVNVEGTSLLSQEASKRCIPFVFISTDLVFDGTAAPYSETDNPTPVSWYGETKAIAEERIRSIIPHHYILRTALMYGMHGKHPGSFLRWTIDGLQAGKQLGLYTNQFRNPLFVADVARCIHRLFESDSAFGIYHIGGPQRLSRYEIGVRIAEIYDLDVSLILPTQSTRVGRFIEIDDTTLNTEKIVASTSMTFTPFDEGIASVHSPRT